MPNPVKAVSSNQRVEPIQPAPAPLAVETFELTLPEEATPPATREEIDHNIHDLHTCRPAFLKKIFDFIDLCGKSIVWIAGYPLFWLGCGMMAFGVGHVFFILATTLSVEALLIGPTLPYLLLGGLFFCLGKYMRENNVDGLNTTMGNLLYVPYRWLNNLSVTFTTAAPAA